MGRRSPGISSLNPFQHTDYICKLTKKFLFWMIQFPCYPHDRLTRKQAAIEATLDDDELGQYESCSSKNISATRQLVVVSAYLIYSVKILFLPWITARTIDFSDLGINTTNKWIVDANTIQVFCVRTNCSQFFLPDTGMTVDIRHFLLIPVCYPTINKVYPPSAYLGPYAVFVHTVTGSATFFWGVMLPLKLFYTPFTCDNLMFLVAPNLTRNLMLLRAEKIYQDYKRSFVNYLRRAEVRSMCHLVRPINGSSSFSREQLEEGVQSYSSVMEERLRRIDYYRSVEGDAIQVDNKSFHFKDRLARDCLPAVRSLSWLPEAQRAFVTALVFVGLCLWTQTTFLGWDVLCRVLKKSSEVAYYADVMMQSGCRVWYPIAPGVRQVLAPRETYAIRVDLLKALSMVDSGFTTFILLLNIVVIALYYSVKYELDRFLAEMQNKSEVLVELTHLRTARDWQRETTKAVAHSDQSPTLDLVQFDRRTLQGKVSTQRYLVDRLSRSELQSDEYSAMMTRLYILFRLFVKHVRHCSKTLPVISNTAFLTTYAVMLISVWHSRLIGQFNALHFEIAIACASWSTIMLGWLAKFHAKSRNTERTLWNLIAALNERDLQNVQIRHLRLLWLKQLIAISEEEGVAIRLFRIRVTYVNIIQSLLWAASLIALAAY